MQSIKTVSEALIIFVKNPVLGNVKTRLAATVGKQHRALLIYQQLLEAYLHLLTLPIILPKTCFL
jgi:glycosyltransferase A (GT-A) superfamily protein (DUF2064 family)